MIQIFSTGGTFDKIYFDALSEFSVGEPQAITILRDAHIQVKYQVESILKKDSLDLTEQDRALIQQKIGQSISETIIITHGTDGMVDTAKFLAAGKNVKKTVVFVGAMQPATLKISDAPFNLGFAIAAVQLLPHGIYIAMNGQVFPYDQVKKNRDAKRFEST